MAFPYERCRRGWTLANFFILKGTESSGMGSTYLGLRVEGLGFRGLGFGSMALVNVGRAKGLEEVLDQVAPCAPFIKCGDASPDNVGLHASCILHASCRPSTRW